MDNEAYVTLRWDPKTVYRSLGVRSSVEIRRLDIRIDGKKISRISRGSEITIPVFPGKHAVELRALWFIKSQIQIIDLKAGEKALLECGKPTTLKVLLTLLPLTGIAWSGLYFKSNPSLLIPGFIVILISWIWYIFGRGTHICLQEPH